MPKLRLIFDGVATEVDMTEDEARALIERGKPVSYDASDGEPFIEPGGTLGERHGTAAARQAETD